MDTDGKFYLGRTIESEKTVLYDPDDLTTHAVVVGMTGSGKTGLCIDLLEEAALNNIPALMIDPKGDITNALLHFPDLLPSDFQPWINPDEARKDDKSIEDAATDTAAFWKKGLAGWDIAPDRIQSLKDAAEFAIYTPGSDAGIPVNILASLKAPEISWDGNSELLRERISGTAIAILGLVGLDDIDPVRSREHILLCNIFETAWKEGNDLNLSELILQTQNPPFEKLGVFDINTFFPEKERFELAMLLNNILASPSFQTWLEGPSLDIANLLYTPDGSPRHSVFYIAHLTDTERMFFVTLLYAAIETWMRAQTGTKGLRALVYFDEIFGYLPPVSNPPSKTLMLRMLKQARAFGVGQVLATQNPVDIDYKALSNAGTWFIGKLQTDRDKERLLDGLQGAAPDLDRRQSDKLISALDKREFLLHNVHDDEAQVFKTRWAMNYLAGPMTRAQIPMLNQLAGVSKSGKLPEKGEVPSRSAKKPTSKSSAEAVLVGTSTRPATPSDIDEYFLPNNLTLSQATKLSEEEIPTDAQSVGLLYRPALLAQAEIRFLQRKYNLDYEQQKTALVLTPERHSTARWEEWIATAVRPNDLDRAPAPKSTFDALDAPLNDGKTLKSLKSDFIDWVYRDTEVAVRSNDILKIYAGPDISQAEFRRMCSEAAQKKRDAEITKTAAQYDRKLDTLEGRLHREERELREDETELSQRKMEEIGKHAENVISLFSGRRRSFSTSLTKRRMTQKAKADVEESVEAIEELEEQVKELEQDLVKAIEEVKNKWSDIVDDVSEIPIQPYKKDILIDLFGVAWMPYHVVKSESGTLELPGYGNK
ncbi:MAG: DUF87 domain-containing protein [Chloroflexi bacterium]|nr:DUF87 domain-containing protein [Chloroflexota bacterium]